MGQGVRSAILALLIAGCTGAAWGQAAPALADPMATAQALNGQGLMLIGAGRMDEARAVLDRATAICDGPLHGEHYCVAATSENLATIARAKGDTAEAERLLRRAAAVTLAAMGPDGLQFAQEELKLGDLLVDSRRLAEAEAPLRTAIAIYARAGDHRNLYTGRTRLSQALTVPGRYPEAFVLLDQAMEDCPDVGPICEPTLHGHRGEILWAQGQSAAGEAELRKAADLYDALTLAESRDAVLLILAHDQIETGKAVSAEAILTPMHAAMVANGTASPDLLAGVEADLAMIYGITGRAAAADALIQGVEARIAAGALGPATQSLVHWKLGVAQARLLRYPEAQELFRRGLAIPIGSAGLPWQARTELGLADILRLQLDYKAAEPLYRKAINDLAADPGQRQLARYGLATLLIELQRLDEGTQILRDLLKEAQAFQPAAPTYVAMMEAQLALALNTAENYKEAQPLAAHALAAYVAGGPDLAIQGAGATVALATAEQGLGDYAAAEAHLATGLALLEKAPVVDPRLVTNTHAQLCEVLGYRGRLPEATACARQVLAQIGAHPELPLQLAMNAHRSLGVALYSDGDPTGGRGELLKALEIGKTLPPDRTFAVMHADLGQIYAALNDPRQAEMAMTKAIAILVTLGASGEDQAVEDRRRLADIYVSQARYREAEPLIRASVDWFNQHMGAGHPRTTLQLRSLARLLMASGRVREAEPVFRQVIALRQAAPAPNPVNIAQSQADLADCEKAQGRYAEARALYLQAVAGEEAARGKTDLWVGEVLQSLASLDAVQGRFKDAEDEYARARALMGGATAAARQADMFLEADLGRLYLVQGRYRQARAALASSAARQAMEFGPQSPRAGWSLADLAGADREAGQLADAEAGSRRSLAILTADFGDQELLLAVPRENLADLLAQLGRGEEAEAMLQQALATTSDQGADQASDYGLLMGAARLEFQLGHLAQAQAYAARALAVAQASGGEAGPTGLAALTLQGEIYLQQGRYAEARAALQASLVGQQALFGADSLQTAWVLQDLAALDRETGRFTDAEAKFKQALGLLRTAYGPQSPKLVPAWMGLANLLIQAERAGEAEQPLLLALSLQRDSSDVLDAERFDLLTTAVEIYAGRPSSKIAADDADQALALARGPLAEQPWTMVTALLVKGDLLRRRGETAEAEPLLVEALSRAQALWGADNPQTLSAVVTLARLRWAQGKLQVAETLLDGARSLAGKTLATSALWNHNIAQDLAWIYLAEKRPAKAAALFKQALAKLVATRGAPDRAAGWLEVGLGQAYLAEGRADDAKAALAAAQSLLGGSVPNAPPDELRL